MGEYILMEFKTRLSNKFADLWNVPKEYYNEEEDLEYSDIQIDFVVDIESREYGIKGIYVHTREVRLNIVKDGYDYKELVIKDSDGLSKEESGGWRIENEIDLEHQSISPVDVQIDFEEKMIIIAYA